MTETELGTLATRKICPNCNFDTDVEPGHAASCSEADWNRPTKVKAQPAATPMPPASFDSETGEVDGDTPFTSKRKHR